MVQHSSDKDLYESTVYTEDSPSPSLLVKLWISWAVLDGVFGLFSFVVWLSILRSKQARSSPFNLYLLFLMLPDWFYNFNFCITSTLNAINGAYWGFPMCMWQSGYSVWGIGANAWLNGLMAWEIHKMLKSSRHMRRYNPPTRRRVVVNGLMVYLLIGLFSAMGSLELDSIYPLDTALHGSLTCGPKPFTTGQTLIVWLFFAPFFVLIPYVYVLYSVLDIYYRKLLPARGKRRILSIYFFRIVAVFLIIWGPVAFLIYFFNEFVIDKDKQHASIFVVAIWAHFQAVLSAAVSLTKPDIYQAVCALLTCTPSEAFQGHPSESTLASNERRQQISRVLSRRLKLFFNGGAVRESEHHAASEHPFPDQQGDHQSSHEKRGHDSNPVWSDIPVQSAVDFQFEDESVTEGDAGHEVDCETAELHDQQAELSEEVASSPVH